MGVLLFRLIKLFRVAEFAALSLVLIVLNVSVLSGLRNKSEQFLTDKRNNKLPAECRLTLILLIFLAVVSIYLC